MLNASVFITRTAKNGVHLHREGGFSDRHLHLFLRKFAGFKEFLHQSVVLFGARFHEVLSCLGGYILIIVGDRTYGEIYAEIVVIDYGIVCDKVDYSAESIFFTDGKADGNSVGFKPFPHHLYGVVEIRTVDIHLVDVRYTGNVILVRLTPNRFGLRLDAAFRTESGYRAVEYAERSFDLDRKVDVSRGVDDVYSVAFPETCGCSRADRYTSFLFLNHEVHSGGAVVNFAEFMGLTGIEQNSFGGSSLTCVDMRHYTDVSGMI